jgi:2-C-methyl-D-erythritol 4-phosphate cytidylyltransferase / 2-C-methyl-D-erythritol 2,4-cyclodiphosphate synthase
MSELAGVVVAAGRGSRMGGDKLWIDLWGRPVWRWSLDALLAVPGLARVALAVPPGEVERFRALLPPVADRCLLVEGGETRSASVEAGLNALVDAGVSSNTLVLVHDAARPATDTSLIEAVVAGAREGGAAIPILSVPDTLKRVDEGLVEATVPRDGLGAAQTPQAASLGILLAALDAARVRGGEPTDEAAALTAIGVPVRAVRGDPANRKLTEDGDLVVLRAVLRERAIGALSDMATPSSLSGAARLGIGFDAHRLEERVPLKLGGLAFPEEPRGLAGHSDGDVALHAVIDALLGAAHLGDIGSLFPEGDSRWDGADSGELVRLTAERLGAAGLRPVGLDLTIVAARPAIAPRREAMEHQIEVLLGLSGGSVSVKGTTSDGLGFAGSEGIAAHAVARVETTPSGPNARDA